MGLSLERKEDRVNMEDGNDGHADYAEQESPPNLPRVGQLDKD
jgi:hypothetical protein